MKGSCLILEPKNKEALLEEIEMKNILTSKSPHKNSILQIKSVKSTQNRSTINEKSLPHEISSKNIEKIIKISNFFKFSKNK